MGQILDHTIPVHHVVLDNLKEKTGRKSCIATAMTDKRLEIDPAAIAQYFESLNQTVSGAPAHFVSNMDEMEHGEWANRKMKTPNHLDECRPCTLLSSVGGPYKERPAAS
jgi:hypothetical protein